jgi:DNA repair photolyase
VTLVSKFDPWRSALCTCPPKLTFNPYTGCDHGCTYCYASSYIPRFSQCRPKKNLIQRLSSEAAKLTGEIVSISNSSDPYPRLEAKMTLMRSCLEILSEHNCKVQIITKSSLVVRDIDLLEKIPSMVSLTITTDDDETARILEPHAPPVSERLKAVEKLVQKGLPIAVRIDPIIPFVNDHFEKLVENLAALGVKHITSSTYKVRQDDWKRFNAAMPEAAAKLRSLYFESGERMAGYIYLPRDLREGLMLRVAVSAKKNGIKFGTCREGLSRLNTNVCDGSWLLDE